MGLSGPVGGCFSDGRSKKGAKSHSRGLRERSRQLSKYQQHCQYSQSTQLNTGSANKTEKPTHVDKVGLVPTLSMSVYRGRLTLGLQTLGTQRRFRTVSVAERIYNLRASQPYINKARSIWIDAAHPARWILMNALRPRRAISVDLAGQIQPALHWSPFFSRRSEGNETIAELPSPIKGFHQLLAHRMEQCFQLDRAPYRSLFFSGHRYGTSDDASRPGGPLMTISVQSNSTGATFRIVADINTVVDLMSLITSNCSSHLGLNEPPQNATAFTIGVHPRQTSRWILPPFVPGKHNALLPLGIDTRLLAYLSASVSEMRAPAALLGQYGPPNASHLRFLSVLAVLIMFGFWVLHKS
ncbi:hypothetical protein B0H14DRAFT_3145648 [Mycena olivaceomarginata]|nr:hypothetical protein B0H14DRAFT_3145648 [Mycena olivaceomarginata]